MDIKVYDKGLYSPKIAAKIARIKYQYFQAWSKANLLQPAYQYSKGKKTENVYTYYDLLRIRLIKRLREKKFSTKKIETALSTIQTMMDGDPYGWTKATIVISAGMIIVYLPGKENWNPIAASKGEQKMEVIFFPELISELQNELIPKHFKYIEINPVILGGNPVIKGTRIPTNLVYSLYKECMDVKEAYPNLTNEQIVEAKEYEEFLLAG